MDYFNNENMFFLKNGRPFGTIKRIGICANNTLFYNKVDEVACPAELTDKVFIRCISREIWEQCNYVAFGKLYYTFPYRKDLIFVPNDNVYASYSDEIQGKLDGYIEISLENYRKANFLQ